MEENSEVELGEALISPVEKCIFMLKKARSDNEKLAALLMVTKHIKAENCDSESQKKIFDAIGFKFLARLLRTAQVPEGCAEYIFKSLSLTILSSFRGNEEVMNHPQMLNMVPLIGEVLLSYKNVEPLESDTQAKDEIRAMVDSCYDCLMAVGQTTKGMKSLVDTRTVSHLCTCYIQATYGNDRAMAVLQQVISGLGADTWTKNMKSLQQLLDYVAEKFANTKEVEKFQFCDILANIFTSVSKELVPTVGSHSWPRNTVHGVVELIISHLGQQHRESTLMLVSVIVDSLGLEFLLPPNLPDAKPFLLAVNLNSVEVGMIIPFSPIEQVREKSNQLSAYFSLIENTISFLVSSEDGPPLDSNQIVQLYSVLTETLKCVVLFLQDTAKSPQPLEASDPLMQACVRLVGIWMREESEALVEEIYELVPVLLEFSGKLLSGEDEETEVEGVPVADSTAVISYLVEGFYQLASDVKGRELLFRHHAHIPIGQYLLQGLNQLHLNHNNDQLCVEVVCDLLIQLMEIDAGLIASESLYVTILDRLSQVHSQLVFESESLNVIAAMSLFGLTLLNIPFLTKELEEEKQKLLLKSVVSFLSRVHLLTSKNPKKESMLVISEEYRQHWDSVSNYWLSTMKALTLNVGFHSDLTTNLLLQSAWIPRMLKLLARVQKASIDGVYSAAYLELVCAIAESQENAKAVIIENEGTAIARKFENSKLLQILEK